MDNNSVTRLWDPNTKLTELRRPCFTANENTDDSSQKSVNNINTSNDKVQCAWDSNTNNVSSISDVAKKSTLSVEAKEWYPPGYQTTQPHYQQSSRNSAPNHSVQNRLNRYRQSDAVKSENNDTFEHVLKYLDDIMNTLTRKPGKFDDLIYSLMDYLEPHFQDIEVISRVTSAIFKQALIESNFQYSGARMFAVLDENCPLVRACLHALCEKELETTQNMQNVALLFAEIYVQLNFELFGKCLLKALEKLSSDSENTKCICKVLKLTGAKLEALDKKLIEDILSKLALQQNMTPSQTDLIQSVITLRENKWGQADIQAVSPPAEPYEWSDGPVFYGPDGMQLTNEESEFLAENLNDFIIDDTDPDGLWNPEPEMNEEIQAAFAEFVRSNNR